MKKDVMPCTKKPAYSTIYIGKEVNTISRKEAKRRQIASHIFKEAWKYVFQSRITLSLALYISWKTTKSLVRIHNSKIRGISKKPIQQIMRKLMTFDPSTIRLRFKRDPSNSYDENAVMVIADVAEKESYHIGYVSKELAQYIGPLLDEGAISLVFLNRITGGTGERKLGCNFSYLIVK